MDLITLAKQLDSQMIEPLATGLSVKSLTLVYGNLIKTVSSITHSFWLVYFVLNLNVQIHV